MRDELAAELKRLPRPSSQLYARYTSAVTGLADAENILFYNVGAGAFTDLDPRLVIFERSFASLNDELPHCVQYSISTPALCWGPSRVLAEWTMPLPVASMGWPDLRVESLWLQVKKSGVAGFRTVPPDRYGLHLVMEAPAGSQPGLMPSIKRLFDGVISGLHCYTGSRLIEVSSRLSSRLSVRSEEISSYLVNEMLAPLGKREVVWPFGAWVQWNPADEHCVQGVLERGISLDGWNLTCRVYEVAGKKD
jgi:hypothetical protein